MGWERIPEESWRDQHGHIARYQWAARQILPGETVLDVGCGIGYGAEILNETKCRYIGVDKYPASKSFSHLGRFFTQDIEIWSPDFDFDVAICFETLEHVKEPVLVADLLRRAKRLILISVPTVPTTEDNRWHLHDFNEWDIPQMFDYLTMLSMIPQPSEKSHMYAFTT
jgi:SAM-dependent methyltransferase